MFRLPFQARGFFGGALLLALLLLLIAATARAPLAVPGTATAQPTARPTLPLVPASLNATSPAGNGGLAQPLRPTPAASGTTAIPLRSLQLTPAAPGTTEVPAPASGPVARSSAAPAAPSAVSAAGGAPARAWPAQARGPRERIGLAVPYGPIDRFDWGGAQPGWYLNWQAEGDAAPLAGTRYTPMVRLEKDGFRPAAEAIVARARLSPGALWLIGNEPDVPEQDNVTAQQYATSYHTLYGIIKAADPTAQVAIGGVSQPTPLRLEYLDHVLAAYRGQYGEDMPVDVWNVHAFILREERGSWGVGIPAGFDVNQGTLYEVADHANMDIFRRQITDFRSWMARHGLQDKPLIVSEYGILMPADYGFPADLVAQFMTDTFDFFLNTRDPQLGDPADDYRLVQAFCWYSTGDKMFPTANLFDPDTGTITAVGEAYKAYMARLK